jgi:CRISPR/Cas system Type II protein with McrA/HNH and RuvC-like nuclease domain
MAWVKWAYMGDNSTMEQKKLKVIGRRNLVLIDLLQDQY